MSYYTPFHMEVTFSAGDATIKRSYDKGANDAMVNMCKAIEYYEKMYAGCEAVQCTISLYDYLNRLIIKQNVPA